MMAASAGGGAAASRGGRWEPVAAQCHHTAQWAGIARSAPVRSRRDRRAAKGPGQRVPGEGGRRTDARRLTVTLVVIFAVAWLLRLLYVLDLRASPLAEAPMLDEYYISRGWDDEGRPSAAESGRLGLTDHVAALRGDMRDVSDRR